MRRIQIVAAVVAMAIAAPAVDAATYQVDVTGTLSNPLGWVAYRPTNSFPTTLRAGDRFSASYSVDLSAMSLVRTRTGISNYSGSVTNLQFDIRSSEYVYHSKSGLFALDILDNLNGQSGIGTSAWMLTSGIVPVDFGTALPVEVVLNIEGYKRGGRLLTTSPEENFANILEFSDVLLTLWFQSGSVLQSFDVINSTATVTVVPEPATWALMISGFGAIGLAMRRKSVSARTRSA